MGQEQPERRTRRGNHQGSVFFATYDGCWRGSITIARGVRKQFRGRTQAEVIEKLLNYRSDHTAEAQLRAFMRKRRGLLSQRRQLPERLRYLIMQRDRFRCRLCGVDADGGAALHVDHRKPVSKGGANDPSNLWTLCWRCNAGKGSDWVPVTDPWPALEA